MRRLLLIMLIAIGLYGTATAQEPTPLSLQQCIDYALKNNVNMKNARLDVLIQQAQNNEVLAAAYPRLNGRAEFDQYPVPMRTLFPTGTFGTFLAPVFAQAGIILPPADPNTPQYSAIQISPTYNATASLSASQTLFDGSVLVALQARKTVIELANRSSDMTEENVRYNVYKAYNSLVIAYRQYDIIKNSLQYARNIEHDIIETQQKGFAEKIDVDRTSVQVNNLATDSLRIGNLLAVSEQVLKYQMGMDINTPIVLTDTSLDAKQSETMALLAAEEDYNRVPAFNLYQTQLKLNEYNVRRYKLAALPTLSLVGSAGYNYGSENLNDMFKSSNYLSNVMWGLQLNVPIFNGFLRQNQVTEARLNVEKSKNTIEYTKLSIDFQTAQSRTTLRNATLQAESQHRNLNLANSVLDLAQRKYKAGVGSNLEVTQAQTDQLRAENNYFSALLDVINAEADLKKALGLLK